VIRGDVTHFEDVMRTVLDVKPDRLINWPTARRGEGNPHQVLRSTSWGWDNCFEAARLAGVSAWSTRLDRGEWPAEPLR